MVSLLSFSLVSVFRSALALALLNLHQNAFFMNTQFACTSYRLLETYFEYRFNNHSSFFLLWLTLLALTLIAVIISSGLILFRTTNLVLVLTSSPPHIHYTLNLHIPIHYTSHAHLHTLHISHTHSDTTSDTTFTFTYSCISHREHINSSVLCVMCDG